jgi:DNA polymerase alpha-associated DNA helicase A
LAQFLPEDLAVITPYVGQLRQLETELKRHQVGKDKLLLNTVDAFQGKECEVVVISTVRSNSEGRVGFLADHR